MEEEEEKFSHESESTLLDEELPSSLTADFSFSLVSEKVLRRGSSASRTIASRTHWTFGGGTGPTESRRGSSKETSIAYEVKREVVSILTK